METKSETFTEILNSDTPVLLDFYADWCGPCQTLSPILKEIATEMGDKVRILKIDVDKNQAIAGQYNISGIPTMVLFKAGKQIWRTSGVLPKSQIIEQINLASTS